MYFNGEKSLYDEGDKVLVHLSKSDGVAIPAVVTSIGVLGGKLSKHLFIYHVMDEQGKDHAVTEHALKKYTEDKL